MDKAPDTLQPCSVDSLVDLLPSVTSSSCGNEFDNHTKFGPQGWAVAHVGFSRCLILFCKKLIVIPDMFHEKMVGTNFLKRLSFSLRIYKATSKSLKGNLYMEYEASLVQAVGSFADVVPGLFRPVFEFVNSNVAIEGSFETPFCCYWKTFLNSFGISQAVIWKELDTELDGSSVNILDSPRCLVNSEKFLYFTGTHLNIECK
ncbi:PREDICTED: auxin transport [Prunus dulcis]|uniref:PREDICTED: auxin transport n=1 Tax=Prunus dulcis TaxID=3755 RepID=A0A5E4EVG3_PRUDU|nr:PREDICTED: auxin transport [Prunus dulcis]